MRKKLILPIIIILSLTLTACAVDKANNPVVNPAGQTASPGKVDKEDIPNTDTTDTDKNDEVVSYGDVTLTFADAFKIYTDKFPDTKIKKLELDTDYGAYVYEVEGYDGTKEYEIKIHPISGEILKETIEDDDNNNKGELTIDQAGRVEAIINKALAEAGEGAIIKEVILKGEDGSVEVEIDKKGLDDVEYKYGIDGTLLEID